MSPNEFSVRLKRIIHRTKLAKSAKVIIDPIGPDTGIFLILLKFPEDTDENKMLAGINLTPSQAKRLYKELGNKIRYMDRMKIEKDA